MGGIMPSVARTLSLDHPLYGKAALIEHRRNILRYARSFPPGPERNRTDRSLCRFAAPAGRIGPDGAYL